MCIPEVTALEGVFRPLVVPEGPDLSLGQGGLEEPKSSYLGPVVNCKVAP